LEEKANSGLPQYGLGDNPMGIFPEFGQEQVEPPKIDPVTGLVIYDDPKYHISFQYPPDWEKLPTGISSFPMEGITLKIMSIRSPSQGIHDLVTVSVTNQTKYLDTDEIVVKTTNNTAQDYADILKLALANSGFEVIRENSTSVSGLPAWRIEYISIGYDVEVFVVKNQTAYTIKFTTPTLKAPESLPVFNKILESVRIT
jgi:hypothetical protein